MKQVNSHGLPWGWRVLYDTVKWVEYRLVSPISSRLMYAQNSIMDNHCLCERCYKRALDGDTRERRKFGMGAQQ